MNWLKKLLMINLLISISALSAIYCAEYTCLDFLFSKFFDSGSCEKDAMMIGMNYFHEPLGGLYKDPYEVDNDFRLMKELGINAVRLWGYDSSVFYYVDVARKYDMQVWLVFQPMFSIKNIDYNTYKRMLISFAKEADAYNISVLFVGNELDLFSDKIPEFRESNLNNTLKELVEVVKENYNGKIGYSTYHWYDPYIIDWSLFNVAGFNVYLGSVPKDMYDYALRNISSLASPYLDVVITEVGALTINEAEKAGGDWTYPMHHRVHHNESAQAHYLQYQLNAIINTGFNKFFIFCWDEPNNQEYDKNKYGYGIYDYIRKRPKEAYFVLKNIFANLNKREC